MRHSSNLVAVRTFLAEAEIACPVEERLAIAAAAARFPGIADTDWERFPADLIPDLEAVPTVRFEAEAVRSIDREVLETRLFAEVAPATASVAHSGIALHLAGIEVSSADM